MTLGETFLIVCLIINAVVVFVAQVITNRARKIEIREDWKRQDVVAAKLMANTAIVVVATNTANEKLEVIHTLVNSNMTAAMKAEMEATVRELAMMQEVIALKKAAGHKPSSEAIAAVEATRLRIAELKSNIKDRLKETEVGGVTKKTELLE